MATEPISKTYGSMGSPLFSTTVSNSDMSGEYRTDIEVGEYLSDFLTLIPSNEKEVTITLLASGNFLKSYELFDDDSGEYYGTEFTKEDTEDMDFNEVYLRANFGFSSMASNVNVAVYRITFTATFEIPEGMVVVGAVTVDGATKEISACYANIDGVWKEASAAHVNVDGAWKLSN